MKSHARVVAIGGGVVRCSVLYHLTRYGWRDVTLVERSELTSGSIWHAAGGFHTLNADPNIAALQGYTIQLYKELEEISGEACGIHHVGGITLASTPDRMDFLKAEVAKHRTMDMDTRIVGPAEIAKMVPVIDTAGVIGRLYNPLDGHLDPTGTTNAYAKAARLQRAEISLRNPVIELNPRADGDWDVVTREGTIVAEHVVNAAGLWVREVGALAGLALPCLPVEHHYMVTDDIPEIYERGWEIPHVIDTQGESYLRQEARGLVLGVYKQDCWHWALDGTPLDFGHELLPTDLDRMMDKLEVAYGRYPCLREAGIKRVINGGMVFAPDGNPLVGPVPGLRGYWCACAVMAGFSQGGGVGRTVAEWIIEGEPSANVFAMDVAPVRRLVHQAQRGGEDARKLPAPLRHLLPERGAAGRPAPVEDTGLQCLEDRKRRLRGGLRARARELLRTRGGGTGRGAELPPLQPLRGRRCGVPRRAHGRRHQRDPQLLQVRGDGAGGRGLAQPYARQPHALGRAHRPQPHAEPEGAPHWGLHGGAPRAGPTTPNDAQPRLYATAQAQIQHKFGILKPGMSSTRSPRRACRSRTTTSPAATPASSTA